MKISQRRIRGLVAIASSVAVITGSLIAIAPAQAATKDLTIGLTLDIDKLDPQGATSFATVRALGLVYGSLVEVGPNLDIRGGLAQSWGFNASGTELRLHLRKNVKFQDGSTFDAEDVKASLERILDPATKAAARANILTIKSIEASGLDVTLNLTIPNVAILAALDGLSVAAQGDPDYPYDDDSDLNPGFTAEEAEDEFEEQLIDAMTTPIRDEESASAVVPLIIRGPAELGDKIKQFKFERSFDPALALRADRVLERILQGLDVPKDVVTGLANVKYSNALQIDESLYKAHIEPLMLLIADAITVVYLRPSLIAQGYSPTDVDRIVVWFDPTAVSTRNDRAADADSGFDRGAVSYETWRRAHGFSDADAPTANELAIRMLSEKGSVTPELTEAMLNTIAPEMMNAVREAQQSSSVAPLPPAVEEILKKASAAPSQAQPAAPEQGVQ